MLCPCKVGLGLGVSQCFRLDSEDFVRVSKPKISASRPLTQTGTAKIS